MRNLLLPEKCIRLSVDDLVGLIGRKLVAGLRNDESTGFRNRDVDLTIDRGSTGRPNADSAANV